MDNVDTTEERNLSLNLMPLTRLTNWYLKSRGLELTEETTFRGPNEGVEAKPRQIEDKVDTRHTYTPRKKREIPR